MSRPYSKELLDFLSKTNSKKVGIQLAKICIKAKLPASGIAEVFGVTRQAVHGWFRGKYIREKKIIAIKKFISKVQNDLDQGNLPTKTQSLSKEYLQSNAIKYTDDNNSNEVLNSIKVHNYTDDYSPKNNYSGYEGEYKNGKYHGYGRLRTDDRGSEIYDDGDECDEYVGEFKNGLYDGQGTLKLSCGTKYIGEFRNGLYDGQGVQTWGDYRDPDYYYEYYDLDKLIYDPINSSEYFFGYIYVGEFKNGEYHGQGILTYISEIKYSGEFKLGRLYSGSLTYFDDLIYFEKGLVVK
ncbi:MAG: hypothetical protein CMD72_03105 [Gammaproteobacteria bacterium]|nr:hypothetical protein [Gammaproteobacteria bacterium]